MRTAARPAGYRQGLMVLAACFSLLAVLLLSAPALAAPALALSPDSGAPGIKVTVTGTVFDSYKGDTIHVFFDSVETDGSPLTVAETGAFTTIMTVPIGAAPGLHLVRVTSGNITSILAEASFTVEAPTVALDAASGRVGTDVVITGSGFPAGGVVALAYDATSLGNETVSGDGHIIHSLAVPESIGGTHRVTAADAAGHYAEASFNVVASVKLNMVSGAPGELLDIRGSGFGYRGNVSVLFGAFYLAAAPASDFGSFEIELSIPDIEPGPYRITVRDAAGNQDTAAFLLGASARLSPGSGAVGAPLTVHGSGFRPGGAVTADFDGQRAGSTMADFNGAFTITFSVPAAPAGGHTILVTDGDNTRQLAFTIESEPPSIPLSRLPADGAMVSSRLAIDWSDAEDPSQPVSYTLEIASEPGFAAPLLRKTGLFESQYNLSANETLKAGSQPVIFFWRTRATDAAGNVGGWSEVWSFSASAPPAPTLLAPAPGTKPESPARFAWQAVSSLSPPVLYTLQVAAKDDFKSPAVEKTGLAATEYTLPEDNPLARGGTLYYWRVRATDAAGNASDWSKPASFTPGSSFRFPAWAIYSLIGVAAAAAIFLAYYLGKSHAARPPEQISGPGDVI